MACHLVNLLDTATGDRRTLPRFEAFDKAEYTTGPFAGQTGLKYLFLMACGIPQGDAAIQAIKCPPAPGQFRIESVQVKGRVVFPLEVSP